MALKKRAILISLFIILTVAAYIVNFLSDKEAASLNGDSSAKVNREADTKNGTVIVNKTSTASTASAESTGAQSVEQDVVNNQNKIIMTVFAKEADELFDIYRKGIAENSSLDEKYAALLVAGPCGEAIAKPLEYGSTKAPDKRPSYEARVRLKDRCKDFFQYDSIAFSKSVSSLNQFRNSDQSKYSDSLYELPRSPNVEQIDNSRKNIKKALETDGTAALSWTSSGLASYLAARARQAGSNPLDPSFKSSETLDAAILIAQCNLGFACGSDSLHYYAICGSTGSCAGNIVDSVYGLLADEDKKSIARKQSQIIESAILSRDFAALGLSD